MTWRLAAIARAVTDFLEPVVEAVFPNPCLGCGTERELRAALLCAACAASVHPVGDRGCRHCGGEPPAGSSPRAAPARCRRCRGRRFAFHGAVAAVRYGGAARAAIHEIKFHGRRDGLALFVSPLAAAVRARGFAPRVDIVVPVPLHPFRRMQRGFDQAELLARAVARELGLAYAGGAISRLRFRRPQSVQVAGARAGNVAGVFVPGWNRRRVRDRRVLLVDDVLTSGATADAAARALLRAGARSVRVAVAAT